MNNFFTLGTTSEALTGHDINAYFIKGNWLTPLKKYIDNDSLLPASTRLSNLPPKSLIVKASSGYGGGGVYIPELGERLPTFFTLYCTGHIPNKGYWGNWTPSLKCYLHLIDKSRESRWGSSTRYLACCGTSEDAKFKESDPDHTLCPTLGFGATSPQIFLTDIARIQIVTEYTLKLLHLGLHYRYNDATHAWLEKGTL